MNNNNRDLQSGETMFDYLKRKKKFMLQKTFNRNKSGNGDFDQTREDQLPQFADKTKRIQSRDKSIRSAHRTQVRADSESNNTPRRVSIIDEERRPAARSFLQMISPIRSKSPIQRQPQQNVKSSPSFQKKDGYKQNYTKKMVQEGVNNLRSKVESMIKSGRTLKQKFHFLSVELQPFFRHLQNNQSHLLKKTQIIRAHIKTLEHKFNQFDISSTENTIESFFKHFSLYLNELEGHSLAEIQSNKNGLIAQMTSSKNAQIADLKDTKKKLEKQLNIQRKQYQKLLKSYQHLEEEIREKSQKSQLSQKQVLNRYQQQVEKLNTMNRQLKSEVDNLLAENQEKQAQLKRLIYQRQKYQQQCFNTINKVKTEQQQFLLNEIMILKKQFNNDINEMAKLHTIKEDQYIFRIKDISQQNQKLRENIDSIIQNSIQAEQNSKSNQAQANRYKKQNQMLAIDMHRINEELYQHWLALKDIKILSMRLDIFTKFKKIYEEMHFNQQLFL